MALISTIKGLVNRVIPAAMSSGDYDDIRVTRYGDVLTTPTMKSRHVLVDEGSYFVATNPTPGTGIQLNANVTAFADTNALFVIQNTDASGGKRVYMDQLLLILAGTAPTGTVAMHFAAKKSSISREPTTAANRTVLTPVQLASGSGRGTICRPLSYANAGAMTVPAALGGDPVVGRCVIPTGLGITGDQYVLSFGGDPEGIAKPGLTATRATDVGAIVGVMPPLIVEPGENLVIHMWWVTAATTAATFEFALGWYER